MTVRTFHCPVMNKPERKLSAGLGDSERAIGYEEPWNDNVKN